MRFRHPDGKYKIGAEAENREKRSDNECGSDHYGRDSKVFCRFVGAWLLPGIITGLRTAGWTGIGRGLSGEFNRGCGEIGGVES